MSEWELKEKSTGDLTVTIDGEEWKGLCAKAFDKLAAKVTIPGFRKGKAPKNLIEKNVSKQEAMLEAINDNANTWLRKGLDDHKVMPISQPQLDIKSMDENSAVVVFTFAVQPEVELGDYKGLEYNVENMEVSDEEMESELNRMRETYADEEVKDGPAENGDIVNINYEGFKDGVAFDGGKAENYNLTLGSGSFIPGFEDQLVGIKAGEEKDLNLTFPEDYSAEELKGAAVVFKVKCNEVKHKSLPEVDDDFAKDVNAPGVETAEDLKKMIRTRLGDNKKQQALNAADSNMLNKLAENAKVELPDVLIDEEVQGMINQLGSQIQQYGMNIQQYLGMMGKKVEDLKNDYKEQAEKNVKLRMVLAKVADAEKLEPKAEDIEKEIQSLADQYKMEVEKVKAAINVNMLKEDLKNQLAYEFVKKNAKKNDAALKAEADSTEEKPAEENK